MFHFQLNKLGEDYMKDFFCNLKFVIIIFLYSFISLLFVACVQSPKKTEDTSGIVALHDDMNKKHGKTPSYYANLAVADGDYDKAYGLYYQECRQGSVIACLNAYYIGEERSLTAYDSVAFGNQLAKSIRQSIEACKHNISLGCVNLFFAFETLDDDDEFVKNIVMPNLKGHNDEQIADKAINMTKKECQQDDAASCFFHARILRTIDHYADVEYFIDKGLDLGFVLAPFVRLPMQSPQTIDYFKRSCVLNEALSCRYVAYWFDNYENNSTRAKEFYKKACSLGLSTACDESRKPLYIQTDELGSPIINRR